MTTMKKILEFLPLIGAILTAVGAVYAQSQRIDSSFWVSAAAVAITTAINWKPQNGAPDETNR